MRPINLLAIERRLPTRLLLVLHTAKIRPPCLDLSACNSGRIRKRRSVANMLVQPMLLVCSTILHSFNCRSEENSSCTFVDSGTRSFFSITPKAGSVQWEHVPRVYISIGPGGKKEKEDVILYLGHRCGYSANTSQPWVERKRGVFSSTGMSFEWPPLVRTGVFFVFISFKRAEQHTFCYVFRPFSRKGVFDYVPSTQSNYLRFYGTSTRGDVFVLYKTKVVDHQNDPCLLRRHIPWYDTVCNPTRNSNIFLGFGWIS